MIFILRQYYCVDGGGDVRSIFLVYYRPVIINLNLQASLAVRQKITLLINSN
jgi:hypothetical protein